MTKTKFKNVNGRLYVSIKPEPSGIINKFEVNTVSGGNIQGLLGISSVSNNSIEYTGSEGIPLAELLKNPLPENNFFYIMEQAAAVFERLIQNNLLPGRIIWDIHDAYINCNTGELRFVYVPVAALQSGMGILSFMKEVAYAAIPVLNRNPEFISKFVYFLESLPVFDADKIEKYIGSVNGEVVKAVKGTDFQNDDDITTESNGDDDNYTMVLNSEKPAQFEDAETVLLNAPDSSQSEPTTDVFSEDAPSQVKYPTLYRVSTDEKTSVNKRVFRIGKERSYVDYFVADNGAVSRSHADIITRNGRYFILDQNSKNKTYVNGREIPAQQEVEIFNGDRIKLANEQFLFEI